MIYSCVGFDIRVWPCDGTIGVDGSAWSHHGDMYKEIMNEFGLQENFYQILQIEDQATLDSVQERVMGYDSCSMIAIQLPLSIAVLNEKKYGYPVANKISLKNYKALGVDIADVNGFFSILSNDEVKSFRKSSGLIPEGDVGEVLEVLQLAGVVDKNHAPYCAVKISSLK